MKKIILSLMCLAAIAIADDGLKNSTDKISQNAKDNSKAVTANDYIEQEKEILQNNGKLLSEVIAVSAKVYVDDESKMVAAFKKGERLFCSNQIVSTKKGWMIEDNWLLTKDDRYYSINQCFIKK